MRTVLYLLLLILLTSCASQPRRDINMLDAYAVEQDLPSQVNPATQSEPEGDLVLPLRRHLTKAELARLDGDFGQAEKELDQVFQLLARLEDQAGHDAVTQAELVASGIEAEQAYLALLPNLGSFSAQSPLTVLFKGEPKTARVPERFGSEGELIQRLRPNCDVPIDINSRVVASMRWFRTEGRLTYATWLRRARVYHPMIQEALRNEGLPEDLFFVSMIESGFNPHARSHAQAVGLWQFIKSTGQMEGLKTGRRSDERRDPVKSTQAAARHLKRLYNELGDWRLVLAAYNSGLDRVERAIDRAGTRDFWKLDLPEETENYVPRFMAAVVMAKDPSLFGFDEAALQ